MTFFKNGITNHTYGDFLCLLTRRVKLRIKTEFHQFDLKEDDHVDDEDNVAIKGDASDTYDLNMQELQSPDEVKVAVNHYLSKFARV